MNKQTHSHIAFYAFCPTKGMKKRVEKRTQFALECNTTFNCKIVGSIRNLVVVVVCVIEDCYVSIRRLKEVVDMRNAVYFLILFWSVCLFVCWPFNTNRLLIADIANAIAIAVHHMRCAYRETDIAYS